jgi:hypothetical protein
MTKLTVVSDGQTDRRTDGRRDRQRDMTKLIVSIRKFANAPNNAHWIAKCAI